MNVLLTNDDGYRSPGLHALVTAFSAFAKVMVVAPDRDQSGVSQALTLRAPIRMHAVKNDHYVVEGPQQIACMWHCRP